MNFHTLWALAKLEMRSCRKLARTWIFFSIALVMCGTLYYDRFRTTSRWPSSSSDWLPPGSIDAQYVFNELFVIFGTIFLIGVVVLSFDFIYRDVRARVNEVMEAKPANNLEIIVGRVLGILSLILIPILLFLFFASCYEVVAQIFNIPHRFGMLPISAMPRMLWSIVPGFLLFCSLVAFIASFVRIRLIVAIVAIGLLIVQGFFVYQLPQSSWEIFSLFLGGSQLHSDLAPAYLSAPLLLNRLATVLISIAFVALATSCLRRTQRHRVIFTASGLGCMFAGALCVISLYVSMHNVEIRKNEWVRAHAEQQIDAFPDIQHIQGSVHLYPGRVIELDLTLNVVPPPTNSTNSVIFSLNPGYRILRVSIDGSEISDYEFSNGLLTFPKSELAEELHQVRLEAKGRPIEHFAYLDQARDYQKEILPFVHTLGMKNYIFHSNFVALVPSVKWYPTSGAAMNEDLLERRPKDIFTSDINVSVPKKWTVAMVGSRELHTSQNRTTFEFNTPTPVPEMALVAANFESRSTRIEGVKFELLFSKKHKRNLTVLAPYTQELKEWVAEQLRKARDWSLEYPYDTFYVVEVPSTLRIFGGGWRMDTVLHPPGMMLMREINLPTARFDLALKFNQIDPTNDGQYVLERLVTYLDEDLQGGNPFSGFSRNFLNHKSSPRGRGSTVLDFLVEELATKLIMERDSLFIPSLWEYGMTSYESASTVYGPDGSRSMGPATKGREVIANLPSTWEEIERTSLFDLEFSSKPIPTFRALLTKIDVLVQSMVEQYGVNEMAHFLRQLTREFQGQSYTLADFYTAAEAAGVASDEWVRGWLEGTTLPGFLVENAQITKLSDAESSKYQTSFVLHNAETVPGMVRVFWSADRRAHFRTRYGDIRFSDPILLSGNQSVQVSIQSEEPLIAIEIDPYLALNRAIFGVPLPRIDEESIVQDSAQPFLSDIDWSPPDSPSVIVDDLDQGFSILGQASEQQIGFNNPFILVIPTVEKEYDFGLPVEKSGWFNRGKWNRVYDDGSYGRYRRTYAMIDEGNEITSAKFSTSLPHSGRWDLEYFMPDPAFLMSRPENTVVAVRGVRQPWHYEAEGQSVPATPEERYLITIRDGNSEWTEAFDITQAGFGWNKVGSYQLGTTEADVLVSDFAGHEDISVFADAIRWTPVDAK